MYAWYMNIECQAKNTQKLTLCSSLQSIQESETYCVHVYISRHHVNFYIPLSSENSWSLASDFSLRDGQKKHFYSMQHWFYSSLQQLTFKSRLHRVLMSNPDKGRVGNVECTCRAVLFPVWIISLENRTHLRKRCKKEMFWVCWNS